MITMKNYTLDHVSAASAAASAICALIAIAFNIRACGDARSALKESRRSNDLASNANVIAQQALDLTKSVSVISTRPWVSLRPIQFPPQQPLL